MKENHHAAPCLYEMVPAMKELNQVPGFHPQQFLRVIQSPVSGKNVWKLDLRYMRAWFRVAHPNGRVRFRQLRITDQLAIFEAQVFLDRGDTEPISNFTAQCTLEDTAGGDYIKAAQDAALETALINAGFGIQFVDLTYEGDGERFGSEVPVGNLMPEKVHQMAGINTINKKEDAAARPADTDRLPVEMPVETAESKTSADSLPVQAAGLLPVQSVAEHLPVNHLEQNPKAETKQPASEAKHLETNTDPVRSTDSSVSNTDIHKVVQMPVSESQSRFTPDMTVAEILEQMTVEEARNMVVDAGICKNWTMGDVAKKRAPSLRYYVYGGYRGDNKIRAAAQIMLEELESQSA